ncbi:cellulose synthase interactive 1-like protein [Tanacetum coccineum]|uniref:Cellulose synthase interactive 1-like protein n=1 Tax=Tanacetum coccineum TaxID=301880 RepID=A0ABQ4YSC0_9ASTR
MAIWHSLSARFKKNLWEPKYDEAVVTCGSMELVVSQEFKLLKVTLAASMVSIFLMKKDNDEKIYRRLASCLGCCKAAGSAIEQQRNSGKNLVMYSRSNKRAVAEAGGVQVVLDLIGLSDTDASVQAAMFIKLLFSNNDIQEYAFSEIVRAITAAIEKDLWATGTVNEEYLKSLNALFGNFLHLRASEPATLSILHLETSLSEATQEAALDALFFLRQAWSACPADISRSQSNDCLPGTLTMIIKCRNNMKQSVRNPSAYCKLTLGNTQSRQTKVVTTGPNPEWDENFV